MSALLLNQALPKWRPLVRKVKKEARFSRSYFHGNRHWRAVGEAGYQLASRDPRIDPAVIFLFALLHDAKRTTEKSDDNDHGRRAAQFAQELHGDLFSLSEKQLALLTSACADHNEKATSTQPTIGACFDGDRLNLVRVGWVVKEEALSTTARL